METYHKIQTLFKRHPDGPKKGKMIRGAWTTPALEYLADLTWEWSEKVDGTNIRVGLTLQGDDYVETDYRGRSDNAVIPAPLLAHLEQTFGRSHYRNAMSQDQVAPWMRDNGLSEVILFGEGYGPKIQNGGLYRDDVSFVLFDVKIGDWWLERDSVDDIARKLGIDAVPIIGQGSLRQAIDVVETGYTFNSQGAVVRFGPGYLQSRWGSFEAEGIVARPATPLFDRKGDRIITKIKGVDFK